MNLLTTGTDPRYLRREPVALPALRGFFYC